MAVEGYYENVEAYKSEPTPPKVRGEASATFSHKDDDSAVMTN